MVDEMTQPVVEHYAALGLVVTVDSAGDDKIAAQALAVLRAHRDRG